MHTGHYYHELEKYCDSGRGDIAEGSIFPGLCMYRNSHIPIYCMTLIENEGFDSERVIYLVVQSDLLT